MTGLQLIVVIAHLVQLDLQPLLVALYTLELLNSLLSLLLLLRQDALILGLHLQHSVRGDLMSLLGCLELALHLLILHIGSRFLLFCKCELLL